MASPLLSERSHNDDPNLSGHRGGQYVHYLPSVAGCQGWAERPCYTAPKDASKLVIELDREEDGRWIAEVSSLPGVMVYGQTRDEAVARVRALALRALGDH